MFQLPSWFRPKSREICSGECLAPSWLFLPSSLPFRLHSRGAWQLLSQYARHSKSLASCSTMGAIIRQGPHHAAQKSTTISGCFEISDEKVGSERIIGLPAYFSAV